MKALLTLFITAFIGSSLLAQNSSGGISIGAINYSGSKSKTEVGIQYTANVRTQFSNLLGWQTEVGFADFEEITLTSEERIIDINGPRTIITEEEFSNNFAYLRTSVAFKIFDINGLHGEILLGPGLFKSSTNNDLRGLAHGELFLSAKLNNKVVIGLPLSYDFVFWDRDDLYSVGLSLRYHL